jgi:precorrin-6B methylase 2
MKPNFLTTLITYLRGIRFKIRCWQKYSRIRILVEKTLFPDGSIFVLDGPFKGMNFLNEPVWGPITPKWIGSYEAPLSDVILEISDCPPTVIIDIGCAEGYYAVGLARRLNGATVHAFDCDWGSMRQTRKLAEHNGVGRNVIVGNWCSFEDITALSSGKDTVVVCDIEGGEQFMMDPAACPALLKCRILVEIHHLEGSVQMMSTLISNRFEATHEITVINDKVRDKSAFLVSSDALLSVNFDEATDEGRGPDPQLWLWITPKSK